MSYANSDMDEFTPPPPNNIPPPLPPPPADLPEAYRAISSTDAHSMAGSDAPRNSSSTIERPRRGSFGFLERTRSKSRTREVPTVTAANGHKMLRKQKLRDEEERLRQIRQQPPPVIPALFGGEGNRPDSINIASSNKASNFSRPHISSPIIPPTSQLPQPPPPPTNLPIAAQGQQYQQPYRTPPMPDQERFGAENGAGRNGEYVAAQLSRAQSTTSGGRQSFSSSQIGNVNSPRRVRRKKDPTPFNILVVGAKNSGKTSFVEFLTSSLAAAANQRHAATPRIPAMDGNFSSSCVETDMDGERIAVTVWDSQGLEKNIVDLQLREISSFIESKFEETFSEEQKVNRAPGTKDTHIHCVLLLLDPVRLDVAVAANRKHASGNAFAAAQGLSGMDEEIDLAAMKILFGKSTIIPVISKADTLTTAHMSYLKQRVWKTVQSEKLDPLEALGLGKDEEDDFQPDSEDEANSDSDDLPIQTDRDSLEMVDAREQQDLDSSDIIDSLADRSFSSKGNTASSHTTPSPAQPFKSTGRRSRLSHRKAQSIDTFEEVFLPFSVLSPDRYAPEITGRQFAWGIADPYNPDHCDFVRLQDSLFAEWRVELRTAAREKWYEGWRTSRLKRNPTRIRQAGGVTPVSAIPRSGRSSSGEGAAVAKMNGAMSPPSSTAGFGRPKTSAGRAEHERQGLQRSATSGSLY